MRKSSVKIMWCEVWSRFGNVGLTQSSGNSLSLSEKWRTFKTYLRRNWISSRFSRPPRDERIARNTTARNTIPAPPAPATSFWSMAMALIATLRVHWNYKYFDHVLFTFYRFSILSWLFSILATLFWYLKYQNSINYILQLCIVSKNLSINVRIKCVQNHLKTVE